MLVRGARVKVEHYIDDAVRVVAYKPRDYVGAGGARFRPVDGQHTRVYSGGRWVWVDIDTGEIMATSDLEKGALRSRRAFLSRVLAHRWSWFGTLTLDGHKLPGGLSRRDPAVVGYILEWFHRLRVDAPGFEYAVVPELHKDGSYHFHVLLSGLPASMVVPAFHGRAPVYQRGRRVYNLAPWQHDIGFTNLSVVTSSLAVGRYMGKYLTKGFHGASLRGVGFRRWMVSRGVAPAPVTQVDVDFLRVDGWHEVRPTDTRPTGDGSGSEPVPGSDSYLGVWVRYGVRGEVWLESLLNLSGSDVDVVGLPRGQLSLLE